jgi:hypothetical protein
MVTNVVARLDTPAETANLRLMNVRQIHANTVNVRTESTDTTVSATPAGLELTAILT